MKAADEILGLIPEAGYISGPDLRRKFNKGKWWWHRFGGIGFYAAMCVLEDAGLVGVGYEDRNLFGFSVRIKTFCRK